MARIDSKVIFVTTSPRTPAKIIPEIDLLYQNFAGQEWNNDTQIAFMELLKEENFFSGKGANDPAFSARDRMNRAPKALGFVRLSPVISLTPAGEKLISAKRKEEVFLRQLLKFQVPSPYHKPSSNAAIFWVKPYLELFRLIRHFGSLKFDELMIFGLQLVDYRKFNTIVEKIDQFRIAKAEKQGNYRSFKGEYLRNELLSIYKTTINLGKTKTRESSDRTIDKFLKTKANLKFDDFGNPMSTAQGNMADIVCDYGDFGLSVEVTMASGQKQYEMEGEPVSRHLAKLKKSSEKPSYCLFIAPTINEACIAHFYALHKMNISYYGGKSTIVPLPLNIFCKMVEDSYKTSYTPQPKHVKRLFERSNELVETCENEQIWFEQIKQEALNWLSIE